MIRGRMVVALALSGVRMRVSAAFVAAVPLAIARVTAGCSQKSEPAGGVAPPAEVGPVADTPIHAFDRLRWAYLNRSTDVYRTLFTADFTVQFSALDPARAAYGDSAWRRDEELLYARHLFTTGTPTEDPVSGIDFYYDPLLVRDDPRPGKAQRWHRQLALLVTVDFLYPQAERQVAGATFFYVVRGDSARIPADLGARPDSSRWYVEGWVDSTWYPGTHPPEVHSWGDMRVRYR